MRWINKITDKRAAYDLIERERPHKTLDELSVEIKERGYSETKLHPTYIGKVCRSLGIEDKPHRLRGRAAKLKQASTVLLNETSSVIKTLTI